MKTVLIKSNEHVYVKKTGEVSFRLKFEDKPLEVSELVAEELLKNSLFEKVGESKKKDEGYKKKLTKIKGIGSKTAEDIIAAYPTENELVTAINKGDKMPFDDDIEAALKANFMGGN